MRSRSSGPPRAIEHAWTFSQMQSSALWWLHGRPVSRESAAGLPLGNDSGASGAAPDRACRRAPGCPVAAAGSGGHFVAVRSTNLLATILNDPFRGRIVADGHRQSGNESEPLLRDEQRRGGSVFLSAPSEPAWRAF